MDNLLTISDLMAKLKASRETIRLWAKNGTIPAPIYLRPKAPRWSESGLQKWLDAKSKAQVDQQRKIAQLSEV